MTAACQYRSGIAIVMIAWGLAGLRAVAAQEERMFQLEETQLIAWAFGNIVSLSDARQRAEDLLAGQIEFVAHIGSLQPAQRRKLELAGRGDIIRFFESVEKLLGALPRGQVRQSEYQEAFQKLAPVQQRFAMGLHERGSLFHKTVRTTLTAEQLHRLDQLEQQRARRHYQAQIAAALVIFDNQVPLTIAQRNRLTELLLAESLPPRMTGNRYDQYYYVFYRMSRLPEAELKAVFDDVEWKVVSRILDLFRGMERTFPQWEEGQEPEGFDF
jgi:hypothetical protein